MSSVFDERVHGGVHVGRRGEREPDALRSVLDFSVNLNPYAPCQPVVDAALSAALDRYPDAAAVGARAAWALELSLSPDEIAVGHGAVDLFWAITRALVQPGDRVVIAEPTFSEVRFAARAALANVEQVVHEPGTTRAEMLQSLAEKAEGARLLYLCSPNNPTGAALRPEHVRLLAERLPDTYLVLDQSFLALSDHAIDLAARFAANVICVRSLTKDFALAGLRIGYLVAAPPVVERIEQARPTWATSAPALAAITVAATQRAFVAQSYSRLRDDRAYLMRGLVALGMHPVPSCTVFVLLPVDDAAQVCALLLTRGVAVRDASSFGLPRHVRIAVRSRADTDRLLDALRSLTGSSGVRPRVLT